MVPNDTRHIVIACSFHWGHLKGLCMLSARFVRLRPTVTVTLFTSPVSYDKVHAEISRGFSEDEQLLRDRIQVVVLAVDPENPWDLEVFDDKFIEQYAKLLTTGSVWCEKAQRPLIVGDGRAPDAVIVAISAYKQLLAARRLQPGVKVLCWFPSPTCGIIPMMGPLGPDTKGLRRRIVEERMAKTGESFEEAAHNALTVGLSDKIIDGPGLPPMYSTETRPQQPYAGVSAAAKFFIPATDLFHEADGILIPSFEAFDPPESIKAMKDFLAFTDRKFYAVGPLMPSGDADSAARGELRQSSKAQETEAFMERILRTREEKSLVYMAFGSAFWPSDPAKIWAFVETLLEKNIPFIFAHASDSAKVPAEIQSKVEAAGLGLLTSWAPQQLILNHPVTGWFVTHCGINSIMETISAGVPMIAWPFGAEQPYNALHCSVTLNIAFELLEVRTGKALKIHRTGRTHAGILEAVRAEAAAVLDQAFGPEGEVKRRNIQKLREAAEQAWSEGGPSKKAVEDILEAL